MKRYNPASDSTTTFIIYMCILVLFIVSAILPLLF